MSNQRPSIVLPIIINIPDTKFNVLITGELVMLMVGRQLT